MPKPNVSYSYFSRSSTASVNSTKRSAEASCFSMLNASQTSYHATGQRYKVPKSTLAELLLEEKDEVVFTGVSG